MPMYADGKSKKVKVGPTVEETSVKTVEVSLSNRGTSANSAELGSEHEECDRAGEPTLVKSVKLLWIDA
jgi:hypothetical protein